MIILYPILTALILYYPLPQNTYVTSGFMEPRPMRYHAGIDFGTYMKTGFPVISPENGEIYHIHIFNGGYGKAIYMKGRSGKIYVFAHLSRFRYDINRYVLKKQFRTFKYTQSLYFNHKFPVTKNEVIAYTGATGIGSPHLHFEMRDSLNNPINPLVFLDIEDTIPPEIDSILIIPLNDKSQASSLPIPVVVHKNDTINLAGQFGIAVYCKDNIDDKKYATIPYLIKTKIGNKIKALFTANRFSYYNNHSAAWYFISDKNEPGIRLYDSPKLPDIDMPTLPRKTAIVITAQDFSGNADTFTFFIDKKTCKRDTVALNSDTLFPNGIIQIISDEKRLSFRNTLLLKSIETNGQYHFFFSPKSDTVFIASDTFYRFSPKGMSIDEGNFNIKLKKNAVRENVVAHIRYENGILNFSFSDTPFESPIVVTNKRYKKKMIFYNTETNGYLGTKRVYISRDISIGTKSDTIPPYADTVYRVADTIFVAASDSTSGININSGKGYFNRYRLLAIPIKKGFKFISNKDIPSKGIFIFKCEDQVGNKLLYKKRF